MDSIFEEDADEVGGEIEAYCPSPRCKADTTHTIISMYEDEVRRVQCVVCGEVHAYRKPRGDGVEADGEGGKHGKQNKRLTWNDAMARASENDLGNARPFSIRDTYEDGDVVHHPTFDIGFVIEQLPDNKVAVIFRDSDDPKILVHNRGDLAARMPEIAEIPVPREAKKKKRGKKADATPAAVAVRSKAEVEAAISRARTAAQARLDEAQRSADERSKKLKADAKKGKVAAKASRSTPAAKAPAAKKPAVKAKAKGAKKPKPVKKAAKPAKKPAAKAKAKAKKPAAKAKPKKKKK